MITEIAKQKLEALREKLDSGTVRSLVKRIGYQKVAVMGEDDTQGHLLTLTGMLKNKEINVDFSPYPEGGFLLDTEVKVDCPFKLVLTIENTDIKSARFKSAGAIPVQEIEIDVKEFDDRYFIETLEEKPVREFLAKEENRHLINELGDFDRLSFQYKYLKLIYFIENLENLDVEWLFSKIGHLREIGDQLGK
ncbi:MAG: hypothetical protein LWY06_19590 [Firmicutes bacterium]|nr:hypothetical protein [Bacillota bacterium]